MPVHAQSRRADAVPRSYLQDSVRQIPRADRRDAAAQLTFVFYELSDFYYEYNPVQKMPKKLKNNKLKALKINLGLNIAMIAIFIFTT